MHKYGSWAFWSTRLDAFSETDCHGWRRWVQTSAIVAGLVAAIMLGVLFFVWPMLLWPGRTGTEFSLLIMIGSMVWAIWQW